MRILLAGATGVIGERLVPLLVAAGHGVVGLTRTPSKVAQLEAAGATGVVVDILDAAAVRAAAVAAAPDIVMHQVTDLPDRALAMPLKVRALGRVRTVGTDNLVAAAAATDARVIAQSIAFPVPAIAQRPVDHLERAVQGARGLVLRYGQFWGEGTWARSAPKGGRALHVDTAAQRTVEALDEPGGILEVLDSGVTRIG
ncbi:NAD-dependent epimerase/dehydratase family protein [Demequina activiva]|uniref:dTDP-glucose 4,6-dehydratase n=1 Tax=Demequina activiva TaxID=1582364 RepID=A0A919UGW5_9MICO|nr:NAD-dependent epimerase/dehydratase family protein [Demequina activiva]GIG55272.1 dTDP-glucose 4,6-dehydratase [Demequina activiva]